MSSRRLKVLQLQPDYNTKANDFADLAEQVFKALPAERYETVMGFLRGQPETGQPITRAERAVYFQFKDKQLKGLRLRAMWTLYRFCREEGFDVVVCNRFKPVSMMLQLNRLLKIPVCIGISHGFGEYDRWYRRSQVQRWVSRAWRFVGVSPAVRDYLLQQRCGFTPRNTFAITNAIDIGQAQALMLSREEARQDLRLPTERRLVGALGRLVPVKGHIYLLQAFARLKDRYPDTDLVIIGKGREEARLRAEAERLGLAQRLHLVGFRPDALQYVRAFDVWAMPSLAEGLGLALLEGMAGELPVIASDVPAMRPLIQGAGGIAVPPAHVDQLQRALDEYLSLGAAQLKAKGRKAFDYLVRHHDIESYRCEYRALIERALNDSGVIV